MVQCLGLRPLSQDMAHTGNSRQAQAGNYAHRQFAVYLHTTDIPSIIAIKTQVPIKLPVFLPTRCLKRGLPVIAGSMVGLVQAGPELYIDAPWRGRG